MQLEKYHKIGYNAFNKPTMHTINYIPKYNMLLRNSELLNLKQMIIDLH